jgi:glycosyltransferase involved in cell wall biosynthesis
MREVGVRPAPASAAGPQRGSARILIGMPAPGATAGGPALHLPMLVEDLRARGHEVVAFGYGRWAEGESLPLKMWHQALDLARYPRLLARVRPDLVHLNTAFDRKAIARDLGFALATRRTRTPLLLKWHGSETDLLATRSPIWRPAVETLLRSVSAVAVLSSEEAAALGRHRHAPVCEVVCNGLDLARYADRAPVRERLGVPPMVPLLLFIGRLLPAKGLLDVVQALPEIAGRYGAHLVVVGDGPVRSEADDRVRALGLADRVRFTGRVSEDEAADYYCGCDVLVFPTYHAEGFPMTVFQSMAAGLGIVTTRQRASADHLREPENCLFVPPRDPGALVLALDRLLGDADLLARMRRANREGARRFDRRAVAAAFSRLYSKLLEDR